MQGRLNDIGMLIATHAEKDGAGKFTTASQELLGDVARWVRLYHMVSPAPPHHMLSPAPPHHSPRPVSHPTPPGSSSGQGKYGLLLAWTACPSLSSAHSVGYSRFSHGKGNRAPRLRP